MGMELELKYAAGEAALARLTALDLPWQETDMASAYYDTADRVLGARRWTLRLRRENGVPVLCCKIPGETVRGVPTRGEWEWRGDAIRDGIPALVARGAPAALAELTEGKPLVAVCGARFTRLAAKVRLPEAVLELAVDRGVLTGGGRRIPLWEVELEHKSGDPEATIAYARSLAEEYSLTEEHRSKYRRALDLAEAAG